MNRQRLKDFAGLAVRLYCYAGMAVFCASFLLTLYAAYF